LGVAGLRTREADSEMLEGDLARSVVRVEGMDCASCAATVEKRAAALPGMRRAVVNFATGRLDAEHDPGLSVQDIEKAVRDAGYGVGRTEEVERTPFWHTPRAIAVYASALLFALGLALGFLGAPDAARVGAYATAIVVGGLPIFRAALAGVRTKHLDMNVLMSAATVGAVGLGEWAEAASVVVLFAAGNALQVYAIDRTRGVVRALVRLAPDEVLVRRGTGEVVVPADEVGVGETVIVRPGERLAVDGEVVEGASAVDEAPVTGECPGGEGLRRRRLLRHPQRLWWVAGAGDEAGRGLDVAEDRAARGGGPGQEGPR
jgi:Cd2+/Zn2+-exporting ATPase